MEIAAQNPPFFLYGRFGHTLLKLGAHRHAGHDFRICQKENVGMNNLIPECGEPIEYGAAPEDRRSVGLVQGVFLPNPSLKHQSLCAVALERVPNGRSDLPVAVMDNGNENLKELGVSGIPSKGDFANASREFGSLGR